MCFGGGQTTYTPPNNPAPYSPANSGSAVSEKTTSAGEGSPAAAEGQASLAASKDAQDKPTAPVNGYSISSGLQTSTL